MAISTQSRFFMRSCLLLGIASCLATMGQVDCRSLIGEPATTFDVMSYGATGDGITDDSLAFIQAWKAACDHTLSPATVVINGNFMVGEVVFAGPCLNQQTITIDIRGTVSANTDPSTYSGMEWITVERVKNVVVTGGGTINGRGDQFWGYGGAGSPLPVSLVFQTVSNCQMHNLNFVDSMGFHSKITDSKDVTVYNVRITAPDLSPNTDGIHVSNTTNVKITDSIIGTGDDCISIGHGSVNVFISGITCGPGHGISIGSLGKRPAEIDVQGITVKNCTLIGTQNGARIKTYRDSPELTASNILYQDIVMDRVKNPIIIDQHYNSRQRAEQSSVRIRDVRFINIKGTTISKIPVNIDCSKKFPCANIELADIQFTPFGKVSNLKSSCASAQTLLRGIQIPPGPAICV